MILRQSNTMHTQNERKNEKEEYLEGEKQPCEEVHALEVHIRWGKCEEGEQVV